MTIAAGTLMWTPAPDQVVASRLHAFEQWLAKRDGVGFEDYEALWQWSVDDVGRFWRAVWDYFDILADGDPSPSLADSAMPGAKWFPRVRLSYAEHVFRQASDARPALICRRESAPATTVSWDALARDVGALAAWLRARGVGAGDRIAAYLPSRPESVVAFLACSSLGAVWTSCSPDMGPAMVIDRLRQVEPTILLATDAYFYAGREHDRQETVAELLKALPSVTTVVHVPSGSDAQVPGWRDSARWSDAVAVAAPLVFERLPFDRADRQILRLGNTKAGHLARLLEQLGSERTFLHALVSQRAANQRRRQRVGANTVALAFDRKRAREHDDRRHSCANHGFARRRQLGCVGSDVENNATFALDHMWEYRTTHQDGAHCLLNQNGFKLIERDVLQQIRRSMAHRGIQQNFYGTERAKDTFDQRLCISSPVCIGRHKPDIDRRMGTAH